MKKNIPNCFKIYNLFFLILIFQSCVEQLQNKPRGVTKISYQEAGVFFINNEYKNPAYVKRAMDNIPSIEMGKKNEIYCSWYASATLNNTIYSSGEGAGNYVTVSLSIDNGDTWMDNKLIIAPIDSSDRVFDQCLWKDPKGVLHLYWCFSKGEWWDGNGGVWETKLDYDGNTIKTSPPREIIKSGVMLNKPIYLSDLNQIMYSPYVFFYGKSLKIGNAGTYLYSSSTNIESEIPTFISKVEMLPKSVITTHAEPKLLQINRDTLNCYIRTDKGIYFSTSTKKENFKNWSNLNKILSLGETPSSRFCVTRLKSGNILFIANNSNTRTNLTAYLSVDNGKTFPYKLLIDNRQLVSYPDATQDEDGNINICYDRERTKAKEILFLKLTENDIMSKNKDNIKIRKVNSF